MTADLITLKRRWLPLFVAGAALFGAGLALFLLWIYRSSPMVGVVVGVLTTPERGVPPRGSLVSLAALLLTLAGGIALVVAARRINASEIGEIDSFWWKVGVAALAGRWWLGEPRVVVAGACDNEAVLPVLRALKTFTGRVTVVMPAGAPRAVLEEVMVALADDERSVREVIGSLGGAAGKFDAPALSAALRLRGRVELAAPTPRLADAIGRADAILLGSSPASQALTGEIGDWVRRARGKKIGLPGLVVGGPEATADLPTLARQAGVLDAALVNNNTVPPLTDGLSYRPVPEAGPEARTVIARDLVDWSQPSRHDPAKLAVFVREAILRE